jgi:rhodanese-related sulfurtransferase
MNLFGLFSKAGQDAGLIGHDEFAAAVKSKSCFTIDVREPNEFAGGHVPGAINRPLSGFDPQQLPSGKPVVLICKSGGRSANALSRARSARLGDVRHYAGGTMGWRGRGESIET